MKYFKDPSTGKVYFSTTRDGKPTKIQRTVFAEVFYCMAMAGLAKATQQTKYKVYFHVPYHLAFYEVFCGGTAPGGTAPGGTAPGVKPCCVMLYYLCLTPALRVGKAAWLLLVQLARVKQRGCLEESEQIGTVAVYPAGVISGCLLGSEIGNAHLYSEREESGPYWFR